MTKKVQPTLEEPTECSPSSSSTVPSSTVNNVPYSLLYVLPKHSPPKASSLPAVPPIPYAANPYSIFTVTVQVPSELILTNTSAPTQVDCPFCHSTITTVTTSVAGRRTCLLTLVLLTFCCLVGGCLLLYLWDDSKETVHTCPSCQQQLARHQPSMAQRGRSRYIWRRARRRT